MKKDLAIIGGLFVLIVVLLIFGKGYVSTGFINTGPSNPQTVVRKDVTTVKSKNLEINAKIANTASLRKKGLSKIDSLPLNQGMLFVFDNDDRYAIWMKDMNFAIDIIWMDKNKKIVDIAQNVTPEPRKKNNQLTVHKPKSSALYILEINAGLSSLNGLQVGDEVEFSL